MSKAQGFARDTRVDHVGSLLRPEELKAAFLRRARGQIDDSALVAAQDEAIRAAVGLPTLVTDTIMHDMAGKARLAQEVIDFGLELANTVQPTAPRSPQSVQPQPAPSQPTPSQTVR